MRALSHRLANDEVILIDGATGTELELLGAAMVDDAWCAMTTLTDPDLVQAVHRTNIEAGAELIIANTYASSRHVLERAGYGQHFEELNTLGVELALAARDQAAASDQGGAPIAVAGSISTTQQGAELPPLEVATANFADQVRLQAEAGVEGFVLEMMRELDQTRTILDAACATGLPVWVGWTCGLDDDGDVRLWNPAYSLAEGLAAIADYPVDVVLVMHSEVADMHPCLDVLSAHWDGALGIYAQTGYFDPPNWVFHDTITPEAYTEACLGWVERGVQVIGGCCGIGPSHIRHLRDRLPKKARRP